MAEPTEYVRHYLDRLHLGDEDARFRLLEAGPGALLPLIEAFGHPENLDIRAEIVWCIWQQRRPEAIDFLATALDDRDPAVWQEALDGIIAIGGTDAVEALRSARRNRSARSSRDGAPAEWLDEALEQILEADSRLS